MKKNQVETVELKSTTKIQQEELESEYELEEERISKLEESLTEITQEGKKEWGKMNRASQESGEPLSIPTYT